MNIQYFSLDWVMNIGMIFFFFVFLMLFTIFTVYILSFFCKKEYGKFQPNVSVLIPAYNEEENIEKCLLSILNSNYDQDKLEIICVDDKSTDKTAEIVSKILKEHKNVKLIKGRHEGKSEALNLGLKHTKFDYVLTVDADTFIDKNFIRAIVRPFSDRKVGATNAIALIHNPRSLIEHFQAVEYNFNNLIRNSFSKMFNNSVWFFGACACFNKKVLEKAGLFRKDILTEDMDISLRIVELGYDVVAVEKALSYTKPCSSIKELFDQRLRWFFGGLQCSIKHKRLFNKNSFAINYLFIEKYFWAAYSVIAIPLIIYQVFYWMPTGFVLIALYLFRWFSLFGPLYVLYKIPEWGLSLVNIFGVSSGIISVFLIINSMVYFKTKFNMYNILAIIFYFPYTIFLNLALLISVIKYLFNKEDYFIDNSS